MALERIQGINAGCMVNRAVHGVARSGTGGHVITNGSCIDSCFVVMRQSLSCWPGSVSCAAVS